MSEKEVKNRWIILFIIVAILSLIGVSALTYRFYPENAVDK